MLIHIVSLVWLGMLLGVSFLATPVKFRAQLLSLPAAVDVGRVTFHAFARVEWVMATALVIAGLMTGQFSSPRLVLLTSGVVGVLIAQAGWFRPLLDERVEKIIAGEVPKQSLLHAIYVALELAKVVLLAAMVVVV